MNKIEKIKSIGYTTEMIKEMTTNEKEFLSKYHNIILDVKNEIYSSSNFKEIPTILNLIKLSIPYKNFHITN